MIFVLSLGRSGSTFILNYLAQLENEFFCYPKEWNVVTWYHKLLDKNGYARVYDLVKQYEHDPKKVEGVEQKLKDLDQNEMITLPTFINHIKNIISSKSKGQFIIKTTDLEYLWLYREIFPNERFILNIRNPVDFIHSFHLFWTKIDYSMFPKHWDTPLHTNAMITLERTFMQSWWFRNTNNTMIVRLEDINIADKESAVKKMKSVILFTGQNLLSDEIYYELFDKQVGINTSTNLQGKIKENAYTNIGLVRSEKMVLMKCSVYIDEFYPGLSLEIINSKNINIFRRFIKYEKIKVKRSRRFNKLRLLKRMLTLFRDAVSA